MKEGTSCFHQRAQVKNVALKAVMFDFGATLFKTASLIILAVCERRTEFSRMQA